MVFAPKMTGCFRRATAQPFLRNKMGPFQVILGNLWQFGPTIWALFRQLQASLPWKLKAGFINRVFFRGNF